MSDNRIVATFEGVDAGVVAIFEKLSAQYTEQQAKLEALNAAMKQVEGEFGVTSDAAKLLQARLDLASRNQTALTQAFQTGQPVIAAYRTQQEQLAEASAAAAAAEREQMAAHAATVAGMQAATEAELAYVTAMDAADARIAEGAAAAAAESEAAWSGMMAASVTAAEASAAATDAAFAEITSATDASVAALEREIAARFAAAESARTEAAADAELAAALAPVVAEEAAAAAEGTTLAGVMPRITAGTGGLTAGLSSMTPEIVAAGAAAIVAGAAFGVAAKSEIDWQTQLNQMQNNAGIAQSSMNGLATTIIQGSQASGQGLDVLAQGMRRIKDYQFDDADAAKIQTAAMQEATATGADYNTVAGMLASTLHQYKMGGDEATNVINTLAQAQIRSSVTMDQWASNTGRAINMASALQVPLQDVLAAEAALTRNGMDAAQAQTQVVNIFTRIVHPTQQAQAEIQKLAQTTPELTHALSAEGLAEYGLTGINNMLVQTYQKLGLTQAQAVEKTLDLMNAQRGGIGDSVLLTKGLNDYENIHKDLNATMSGQSTPVQDQYNRTLETTQNQLDRVGASIKSALPGIGDLALSVTGVTKALDDTDTVAPRLANIGKALGDLDAQLAQGKGFGELWSALFDPPKKDAPIAAAAINTFAQAAMQDVNNLGSGLANQQKAWDDYTTAATNDISNVEGFLNDNDKTIQNWNQVGETATQKQTAAWDAWRTQLQDALDNINQDIVNQEAVVEHSTGTIHDAAVAKVAALTAERDNVVTLMKNESDAFAAAADNALIAANKIYQAFNHQPGFAPGGQNNMGTITGSQFSLPGTYDFKAPPHTDNKGYYPFDFSPNGSGIPGTDSSHTVDINPAHAKKAKAASDAAARKADNAADASRQADNEMNLVRAKQAVDDIQAKLNADTDKYVKLIDDENDAVEKLKDKEAAALAPIEAGLQNAQRVQQSEAKKSDDAIHGLDVQIHGLTGSLKEFDKNAAAALVPFQAAVDAAKANVAELQAELQNADAYFSNAAHALSDKVYDLGVAEHNAMAPFDAQIRSQTDALWQENQAIQALQDTLSNEQYAEQQVQQAYQDRAYVLEQKILPLQNELNRMKREDQALSNANALHDEAVKTENLAAQLNNLIPGSQEYLRVQKELTDQQTHQSRMGREDKLTDQVALLNEQKTLIDQQAQAQAHASEVAMRADQARLHSMQEQARMDSERLAQLQHEREMEDRTYQDQKAVLDAQNAANSHAKEDYDQLENKKIADAQADAQRAISALTLQANLNLQGHNLIQSQIDDLTELRNTKQWEFQESDRINTAIVNGYKSAASDITGYYDGLIKTHTDNVKKLTQQEKDDVAPLKDALKQAQQTYQDLSNAYQIVEKIDSASDKGAKNIPGAADALDQAHKAIDAIVPKLPPLTAGISTMNTAFTDTVTKVQPVVAQAFNPAFDGSLANIYRKAFDKTDTTTGNSLLGTWNGGFDDMYAHLNDAWGPQTDLALGHWLAVLAATMTRGMGAVVSAWDSAWTNVSVPTGPPNVPHMASGGIVDRPTLALIGEAGPEAIVPLSSRGSVPYLGGGGGGGGLTIGQLNVTIPAQRISGNVSDLRPIARNLGIVLQEEFNRHGSGSPFGK